MAPDTLRRVFAPCVVPERFKRAYPMPLAMRASQMRAVDDEAAMLLDAAKVLSRLYGELSVPVRLIAGSDDRIVDTDEHSARLHRELGTSTFHRVPGCGHMVHHAAPEEVLAAIAALGRAHGSNAASPTGCGCDQTAAAQLAAHRRKPRGGLRPRAITVSNEPLGR